MNKTDYEDGGKIVWKQEYFFIIIGYQRIDSDITHFYEDLLVYYFITLFLSYKLIYIRLNVSIGLHCFHIFL